MSTWNVYSDGPEPHPSTNDNTCCSYGATADITSVLGHMNARKLDTQSTKLNLVDDDKFVDKLDMDNNTLDLPKPGVLWTYEGQVSTHVVLFDD